MNSRNLQEGGLPTTNSHFSDGSGGMVVNNGHLRTYGKAGCQQPTAISVMEGGKKDEGGGTVETYGKTGCQQPTAISVSLVPDIERSLMLALPTMM